MRHIQHVFASIAIIALTASAVVTRAHPAEASTGLTRRAAQAEGRSAGADLPPAEIVNDEGGPAAVTGEWRYTAANVGAHFKEPVAVLMDVSRQVRGKFDEWVPRSGQIIGTLTRPVAPSPTAFRVEAPIQPSGASVDVDNDGQKDAGVQILAAVLGTNLVGDSYLEQNEQDGFTSYLKDPQTGAIRKGTFLVFAPDAAQGFPSGAGEDGLFFTADDPAVALPAGYTLATLTEDGKVTFDRAREAKMDLREPAAVASPDFSKQGILESFNSLIDMLSVRYSYTDLRGLDWEAIRQKYLPQVQAADKSGDFSAYFAALNDLALSIRDAHVTVISSNRQYSQAMIAKVAEDFSGSLGAQVTELSDGRFVVTYLDPKGPAAQAGWQVGTEIVSVDGAPIGERVNALPFAEPTGNPEVIRLEQTKLALAFPTGLETTIEYRQPGDDDVISATLTAGAGFAMAAPKLSPDPADISFKKLDDGTFYIQWKAFNDPLYKMAVWEKFLSEAQGTPGIIIDLRHNGGGAVDLFYTMASYFFTPDDPARLHWIDNYVYDERVGDLVKEFAADNPLSSPKPELTFNGAVAVIVGEGSASAAEYLPQFLQRQGRAIVVGEHGTEGAGGYLERAALPGGLTFLFTKGRTTFAGTDELNLEAKGVTLDVRVPITLENERAKQEGRDVVLEAAVAAVGEEAARLAAEKLPGTTWQLAMLEEVFGDLAKYAVEDPAAYSITFAADGAMSIRADCNEVKAKYTLGAAGALTITPGPATLAACPEGSLSEKFLQTVSKAASFQTDGKSMVIAANTDAGAAIMLLRIAGSPAAAPPAASGKDAPKGEALPADTGTQMKEKRPESVTALEAAYGAPSQAAFGSAVFHEPLKPGDSLEQAALAKYKYFVGELWERWGEKAWMGPWKEVYAREVGAKPDVVAELRGIEDRDAALSVPMILDSIEGAEKARAALAAAFDDPAITELRVFNLGDGGAMSGLLIAGRRAEPADATFLVFLLD